MSQATVLKGPLPQALDVERSVLASMLIDARALATGIDMLCADDFYTGGHGALFRAMAGLQEKGKPVDLLTVCESLRCSGELDGAGGAAGIAELCEHIATSPNIGHHARILREKSLLRRLIKETWEVNTACFEPDAVAVELVADAERRVFGLAGQESQTEFETPKQLLPRAFDLLEQRRKRGGAGLLTGFPHLDAKIAGLGAGDLVIIAGRPGMGKTAFALSVALNVSRRGPGVAIFELEMSREQLIDRALCIEAEVDTIAMRTGKMEQYDVNKLGEAAGPLTDLPLYIDDRPGLTIGQLIGRARRLKRRHDIGLLVLDYMQLMTFQGRRENRQVEVSDISRGLKLMAKELGIPVIALSQLSRAVEQRAGEHRPQLSDLRESGSIEQDADLVLFLYREEVYGETDSNKGRAEVIIGKQRNGPTGIVPIAFKDWCAKFFEEKGTGL